MTLQMGMMEMRKISIRASVSMIVAGALLSMGSVSAAAKDVIIHAGTLIDGTMAPPRTHVSIRITDDRIVAVEDGFTAAPGAEVIDLSGATVLPGMIDMHTHLFHVTEASEVKNHYEAGNEAVINVLRNAYHDLSTGFTSVRDVGTWGVDFRPIIRAIADDRVVGARIWPSLEPLGPAGGHSDPWNFGMDGVSSETREMSLVRGPIDAAEKVREHARRGAKVIKIMPSGGVSSLDDNPHAMVMTYEEIKAIVDTAHGLGLKVAAHAHGLDAIKACVRVGCDSIEHGTYADEEALKEMKRKGIYLDPSPLVAAWKYETGLAHPEFFDRRVLEKGMKTWPVVIGVTAKAQAVGVKMVLGTDQSALGKGLPKAMGIKRLVEAGMTPQQAIVAATGNAADLLGSSDVGVIAAGRLADIIAVGGDPLRDITILQSVDFVMKGGTVYKKDGAMTGALR